VELHTNRGVQEEMGNNVIRKVELEDLELEIIGIWGCNQG
jgi:hypothetical protein